MPLSIYIDLDSKAMKQIVDKLGDDMNDKMVEVIKEAGEYTQNLWAEAVSGSSKGLPGMRPIDDPLYEAMVREPSALTVDEDALVATIDPEDHEYVEMIENGYPPFDLKPGLLMRHTAKVGKQGQRYVKVGITNKTGKYSDRRKTKRVAMMSGPYLRGGKPIQGSYTWKKKDSAGLVMTGTGEITVRTVSEPWTDKKGRQKGSDPFSWIHPGVAGNRIVEAVREAGNTKLQELMQKAFSKLFEK